MGKTTKSYQNNDYITIINVTLQSVSFVYIVISKWNLFCYDGYFYTVSIAVELFQYITFASLVTGKFYLKTNRVYKQSFICLSF